MPLSTWIATWRGNTAATGYIHHLETVARQGVGFLGRGSEVMDTAYVREEPTW